ncbi:MAG: isoprenylcysteine carboxylmethyltransferase family protein [candidate division Zixibacteria bacterium]
MKEKNGEHPFGDTGQLIFLALFIIVWVLDSFVMRISTLPSTYLPLYVRLPVALVVFAFSIYLAKASHHVVGSDQRPQQVISDGIFSRMRHPLYMSVILFYLALIIPTFSIISFALWILIFFFYNFIAGYEEKLMEEKFGQDYITYKQKTAKWLPGVW